MRPAPPALRRLRMARFGDNMRNVAVTDGDKVEAEHRFGVSVNSYAVNDLVAVVDQVDDAAVDELITTYLDLYDVATELRPGGDERPSSRRGPHRGRAARLPRRRRLPRVHHQLRGPRWPAPASRTRRPALDGGRIRLRRRGRLEDRGDGPHAEGDVGGLPRRDLVHGGLHVPPRTRHTEGARRPHARGVPVDHDLDCSRRDPPARHRRPRTIRCDCGSSPIRARRSSSAWRTSATASGSCSTRSISSSPTSRCRGCRSLTPCGQPRPSMTTALECWLTSGGPHHTVLSSSVDTDAFHDLATMLRTELVVIDERHDARGASPTSCAGTRPTTAWPKVSDLTCNRPPSRTREGGCTVIWRPLVRRSVARVSPQGGLSRAGSASVEFPPGGRSQTLSPRAVAQLLTLAPRTARFDRTALFCSAPDAGGGVDDVGELGPLLILGEGVALDGAGEAALRAEAELVERRVLGGLVDAEPRARRTTRARDACW